MKTWFLILFVSLLTSCSDSAFHEDKIFAGGVVATKAQLNSGKQIYMEYCMACHGAKGDGNGVARLALWPPGHMIGPTKYQTRATTRVKRGRSLE